VTKPTRTTNRLHFSDLDPLRFEELSYEIVRRYHKWERINHDGRCGSDEGGDIRATRMTERGVLEYWSIQCKRYQRFLAKDARKVVEDAVAKGSEQIDVLLVIVGCGVSLSVRRILENKAAENSIEKAYVWDATELEAKLSSEYCDIYQKFFGIESESEARPLPHTRDVELLLKFRRLISEKEMHFLLEHEFGAGVYQKQIENFWTLSEIWHGVYYEFQDEEINELFRKVIEGNRTLVELMSERLFHDDDGTNRLVPESNPHRIPGLNKITRDGIKQMNKTAREVWVAVNEFERCARKKIRTL
jgi:hypothetical protein